MQGVCTKEIDLRSNHPKLNRDITPLPGEIWKDIKEWKGHELQEGYQISNMGRIRNLGRVLIQKGSNGKMIKHPYPACMMKLTKDPDGYLFTNLCRVDKGSPITGRVHQLVATFFLNATPQPGQTQVNHIDGNKENNTPENLEWASPDENNRHAREHGLARLGTSQSIHGRIIEWGVILESKAKADKALGRYSGYIDYCKLHNLPIIDKHSGQEVHVEWITREDNNEYYRRNKEQ